MHGRVFAIRQVCEKYLANGKDVFWAFMDLECTELEENY